MEKLTPDIFKLDCPPRPENEDEPCLNCGEPWGHHGRWLCSHKDGSEAYTDKRDKFHELPTAFRFFIAPYRRLLAYTGPTCSCGIPSGACAGCFEARASTT